MINKHTLLQYLQRVSLFVLILNFAFITPLNAVTEKNSFRAQNGVIYTDDCGPGGSSGSGGGSTSVTGSENGWVFPVTKGTPITSEYAEDRGYKHRGVDLGAPMDSPIYASRDGTVVESGPAEGFGNWIVIQHDVNGKRVDSVYGHMKSKDLLVKKGAKVTAGQHISNIGSEGGSSGPHLHYEEWDGGRSGGTERKPEAVYGKSGTATGGDSDTSAMSQQSSKSSSAPACCPTTAAGGAVVSGGGDGGGCGEQGYGEGKRNSEANKQQIWSFLKNKGLSDVAAAGILGNLDQESGGFMPDAENWLSPPCIGIIQWCYDRRENLINFASAKGSEWSCLGTQLEFMWHEVTETSEGSVMANLTAARTPSEAADVWAREYERPQEHEIAGRAGKAELHYTAMTGKSGTALGSSGSANCASASSNGGIMSADCTALVEKYKQLRTSGKLKETVPEAIDQDIKNCTEDPIVCGTEDGNGGGVHPVLLRAVVAGIENSGGGELEVWNMNTRHPCDQFNHPPGKASDIYCLGNPGATQKCNDIFRYYYDNYDELKLSELIWFMPPDGIACGGKVICDDSHADHIHIGVRP